MAAKQRVVTASFLTGYASVCLCTTSNASAESTNTPTQRKFAVCMQVALGVVLVVVIRIVLRVVLRVVLNHYHHHHQYKHWAELEM